MHTNIQAARQKGPSLHDWRWTSNGRVNDLHSTSLQSHPVANTGSLAKNKLVGVQAFFTTSFNDAPWQ